MTRLAFTGHRGLPQTTERLVEAALRTKVGRYPAAELVGLSCIADGADTLFAHAVLDAGGSLTVVVPAVQYREGLPAEHHPTYDALLDRADEVIRLDRTESDLIWPDRGAAGLGSVWITESGPEPDPDRRNIDGAMIM